MVALSLPPSMMHERPRPFVASGRCGGRQNVDELAWRERRLIAAGGFSVGHVRANLIGCGGSPLSPRRYGPTSDLRLQA